MSLHTTELGERGSRIVFCHGLFGQGRNWTAIGKAFSADHRVTLVDMPHHGRSEWPESVSYEDMADRVAALLSEDDPVTLVGHSMGGKTAMVLALRHPALVERLCVVDIAPVAYRRGTEFEGYIAAMAGMDLATLESRGAADAALVEAVPDATVRGFLLQNLRRDDSGWRWQANLDVIGRDLSSITGWVDGLEGVAPYPGRTLWVGGSESYYVRDEHAEAMEALFPRVRRVTVKGAGHWVHSQKPDVFVDILRQFVLASPA